MSGEEIDKISPWSEGIQDRIQAFIDSRKFDYPKVLVVMYGDLDFSFFMVCPEIKRIQKGGASEQK